MPMSSAAASIVTDPSSPTIQSPPSVRVDFDLRRLHRTRHLASVGCCGRTCLKEDGSDGLVHMVIRACNVTPAREIRVLAVSPLVVAPTHSSTGVALAFIIRARLVVMTTWLPDEVVVILGDEIPAAAPAADVLQDHVPGSLGVLALRQVQDFRHGSSWTTILDRGIGRGKSPGESTADVDPRRRRPDGNARSACPVTQPPSVGLHGT
jgi:hypothetical protein